MWIMFLPEEGIYPVTKTFIPILMTTWSWAGKATRQGDNWVNSSTDKYGSVTQVRDSYEYPKWTFHTSKILRFLQEMGN